MLKLTDRIKEVSKNLQTISPVDADNLIKAIDELKLQKIDVIQIKKQAEENKIKINELEGSESLTVGKKIIIPGKCKF